MFQKIISHLYSYNDNKWHRINEFLKEQFSDENINDVKIAIEKLVQNNRILIENNTHTRLNLGSRINDSDYQNTLRDLDNLEIKAKLTHEEREKLQLGNKGDKGEIDLMNRVLNQLNTKDISHCHRFDELSETANIDKNTLEVICKKIDKLGDCGYHPDCISITGQGKYKVEHGGYKVEENIKTQSVTNEDKKIKPKPWYETPLFKYFIFPLLVAVLAGIILYKIL